MVTLERGAPLLAGASRAEDQLCPGLERVPVEIHARAKAPVEEKLEAADGRFPATAARESLWPLHDGARYQRAPCRRVPQPERMARKTSTN